MECNIRLLSKKAVAMYLAPGYATYDFFLAYNSHISDHGLPTNVHSDKGLLLLKVKLPITDGKLLQKDHQNKVHPGNLLPLLASGGIEQWKFL